MKTRRLVSAVAVLALIAACSDDPRTKSSSPIAPPNLSIQSGQKFYVAPPNANPPGVYTNDGSSGAPWTLKRALDNGFSTPAAGDTVYLKDGTYTGNFRGFRAGAVGSPIVYRQLSSTAGAATIDGTIRMDGANTVLWGFTVVRSAATMTNDNLPAVEAEGANQKFIHLIIHDAAQQGLTVWDAATNAEVYGCIVYNNGYEYNQDHGIYLHNTRGSGTKTVDLNVFFNNLGYGVHAYAGPEGPAQGEIQILRNVSFNNGTISPTYVAKGNILVGDEFGGATNIKIQENYVVHSQSAEGVGIWAGYQAAGANIQVDYNRIWGGRTGLLMKSWTSALVEENQIGGAGHYVVDLEDASLSNYTWRGQDFFHTATETGWNWVPQGPLDFSAWKSATGLGTGTPPDVIVGQSGDWWSTYYQSFAVNKYEPGRGMLIVFNEQASSSISVSLAGFLTTGATYKIFNVFDLVNPVATGTYAGGNITLPLTVKSPPVPISRNGITTAEPTGSFFFTFIVTKG
jgi:hypothetical protein